MPEWKDTVNLPRTDFPMKANLPTSEPETLARWAAMDLYGKIRERRAGRAEVRAARRPAVRQRQHPHGHGAQQDPQGFRRQVAVDGRLRRARTSSATTATACRSSCRSTASSGPKKREMSVAEFCRACRAYAERFVGTMTDAVPAPRRPRHLGPAVPDDGLPVPGGDRARVRPVRRAGAGLQGQEAGALVHPLPHRAGRSGSRVRGSHVAVDLRRVPARAGRAPRELAARVPALAGRDVSVLIWTTTPWTIPSNLAVAFHPEFDYAAYDVDGRAVIVAEALAPTVGAGGRPAVRRAGRADEGRASSSASASGIRSTTATRSACSATTSRSTRAPAPCTPRRATAPTTSTPA